MSLGEKISELIFEKKITQKKLSNDLNIPPSTLNGYIRDFREPDIFTLKKLAGYFNVTVDYLVDNHVTLKSKSDCTASKQEIELLNIYRCLCDKHQELLIEQGKLLIKMGNKWGFLKNH